MTNIPDTQGSNAEERNTALPRGMDLDAGGVSSSIPAATPPLDDASGTTLKKKVLYIEDNVPNIQLIDRILRKRPHTQLLVATRGQDGLDMAFEHGPALILLDLNLPDMNGDQVLEGLRADTRTQAIPVVIISADATEGRMDRLHGRPQRFMSKPFSVVQFLSMIDEMLT